MSVAIDKQPIYLTDINRVLAQLGLPELTAEQCRLAGSRYNRDDIKEALNLAPTNASWRTWLRELVEAVRSASPAASQPQMPPPVRREANPGHAVSTVPTPPPAANERSGSKENRLAEINRVLVSIGCHPITTVQAQSLATTVSTEHLKRAIAEAKSNTRAADWLRGVVSKVAVTDRTQDNSPNKRGSTRQHSPDANRQRPAAASQRQSAEPDDSQNRSVRHDQAVAYGAKAAIAFQELDLAERQQERTGYSRSILIKAALAKDGQDCKKGIAWNTAVMINLGQHEVQLIAAVLMNQIPSVRFAGHGHSNEKWLEFSQVTDERFKGAVMATICEGKGRPKINVSITHTDLGHILSMFLRVCSHQLRLDNQAELVLATIRTVASQYAEAMERKRSATQSRN